MLTVKSERNERQSEMQRSVEESEFINGGDLLDSIDFDDLFAGIGDGDVLPDLEMDQEILAEFSGSEIEKNHVKSENASPDSVSGSGQGPEPESKPATKNPASKETERIGKNPAGKKKAKVEWTPELHRRFVAAVEQLGIDKAVPSRILEIMGIDCLTRHNIASHLQKYRSHRKHLQAREAEAANWSRRRQIYGIAAAGVAAAAIGFPPVVPHFRPLHVWGHPSVDQSLMHTWPKHIAPPPPLVDLSHHQYVSPVPGTLRFPPTRLAPPPASNAQTLSPTPSNVHPSNESIDAAIGDVIKKPWLPLPLGLKPPSMEVVIAELQRQGVSKIPPP